MRWEEAHGSEGQRLANRQQEIGEAAARMDTTNNQPILAIKLNESKCEQSRTWMMWYLG